MNRYSVTIYTNHSDIEITMKMDEDSLKETIMNYRNIDILDLLCIEDDTEDYEWYIPKKNIVAIEVKNEQ